MSDIFNGHSTTLFTVQEFRKITDQQQNLTRKTLI